MTKEIENIQEKMNWHWRDTMRTIRFLNFDARVGVLIPVWIIYMRISTIIISFMVFYTFNYFEKKGLTFPAALRAFRAWLIGKYRPGIVSSQIRKFIDYG